MKHYNVNTVALKVPQSDLALNGNPTRNPVIGIWSSTVKRDSQNRLVQVSRLGNPLVNEVVIPLRYKDAFNSITPNVDHTLAPVVAKVLTPEVPILVKSIYGINAPATPRNDLFEVFLTGIAKSAKTATGGAAPIAVDLNSQLLNKDVQAKNFVPAEELRLNLTVPPTATPTVSVWSAATSPGSRTDGAWPTMSSTSSSERSREPCRRTPTATPSATGSTATTLTTRSASRSRPCRTPGEGYPGGQSSGESISSATSFVGASLTAGT